MSNLPSLSVSHILCMDDFGMVLYSGSAHNNGGLSGRFGGARVFFVAQFDDAFEVPLCRFSYWSKRMGLLLCGGSRYPRACNLSLPLMLTTRSCVWVSHSVCCNGGVLCRTTAYSTTLGCSRVRPRSPMRMRAAM